MANPPKPIELKKKLGDPGKRLPKDAKSVELDRISEVRPPDDLLPEGRELWEEIMPVFERYGALNSTDLPAIKAMCTAWARGQRLARVLDEQGYFSQGSTGQMVEHPAAKMEREYMAVFLRYASEFGLTWIARSRLGLTEATRQAIMRGMDANLGANPRSTD
jgi:P27 family predicted phage terminase small subunit